MAAARQIPQIQTHFSNTYKIKAMSLKYDRISVLRVSTRRKAYTVNLNAVPICEILAENHIQAALKGISEAERTLQAEEKRSLTKEFSVKVNDI